jgi:hypothetical protein
MTAGDLFRNNPRDYALDLAMEGYVSEYTLLLACLKYMSHDDVRDMLDCNELSPRFDTTDDDEDRGDA